MIASLTIVRYPKVYIPLALVSMVLFRIPLLLNRKIGFWKLLGCGKNGTFDLRPDWQQWGLLATWQQETDLKRFLSDSLIHHWWRFFTHEQWTVVLAPLEGHGKWDGTEPFPCTQATDPYMGPVAVLTRATIRLKKLKAFWQAVPSVAEHLQQRPGFIASVGIGEVPFFKQATFSLWEQLDHAKQFAYHTTTHAAVIHKTRKEQWYSEEMFVRFRPLHSEGSLHGCNPLSGKIHVAQSPPPSN